MLQVSARDTYFFTKKYVVPLMTKYIQCSSSVFIRRGKKWRKKEEINENIANDRVPAKDTFCLRSQYCTKEVGCICVENKSICLVFMLLECVWE